MILVDCEPDLDGHAVGQSRTGFDNVYLGDIAQPTAITFRPATRLLGLALIVTNDRALPGRLAGVLASTGPSGIFVLATSSPLI